jgi:hypothetical protein
MVAAGIIHPFAAPPGAGAAATFAGWQTPALTGSVPLGHTLHSNSDALGSAAQFNRSVSAMPSHDSRNFARPSGQGTADTLSKGYRAFTGPILSHCISRGMPVLRD